MKPILKPPDISAMTLAMQELLRQLNEFYGVGAVVPDDQGGFVMQRHNRTTNKLQYSLDGKVWVDY
jgi:hypothetical protein